MKKIITLLIILFISSASIAQLVVTNAAPYNSPSYLVNNVLIGEGISIVNLTYFGHLNQLGYFSNGLTGVNSLGLDSGIVFSSGLVNDIPIGGNQPSTNNGGAGDPDLLTIAQSVNGGITSTHDAQTLEFDFIPIGDIVEFRFVFASDEYLTHVNTIFNDIFSFFISGPGFAGPYTAPVGFPNGAENLAVVPGTTTPITISTIHPGLNSQYYINNPGNTTHDFNGHTTVMSIKFHVTCNAIYHFKFAIADCQDGFLDTGVFMEGSSFSSKAPVVIDFSTAATGGDSMVVEGCESAILNLTRSDTAGDLTVHYTIGGTATNGVDYNTIVDSVTYLTGIDTATIAITPLLDAFIEGQETIIISTTSSNSCGNTFISSDTLFIVDVPITTSTSTNVNLNCPTDSVEISATVTGVPEPYSYTWTDTQGNTFYDSSYIFVPALVTDTFYLTATSYCNLITVNDTVIVTVTPLFSLTTTQSDTNICLGDVINFVTTTSVFGGTYTYNWTSNTGILSAPASNATNGTFNTSGSDTIRVTVTDNSGPLTCVRTDTVLVNTNTPPILNTVSPDTLICLNGTTTLYATASGSNPPINLIWDNGLVGNGPHSFSPTTTSIYNVYAQDANGCVSDTQSIIVTVDACTGINESSNEFGITIYPNPNNGNFIVEKPSNLSKVVQIKLLDASSKLILDKTIPDNLPKALIDITNYSNGLYYLQIIVDDKVQVKQILKN